MGIEVSPSGLETLCRPLSRENKKNPNSGWTSSAFSGRRGVPGTRGSGAGARAPVGKANPAARRPALPGPDRNGSARPFGISQERPSARQDSREPGRRVHRRGGVPGKGAMLRKRRSNVGKARRREPGDNGRARGRNGRSAHGHRPGSEARVGERPAMGLERHRVVPRASGGKRFRCQKTDGITQTTRQIARHRRFAAAGLRRRLHTLLDVPLACDRRRGADGTGRRSVTTGVSASSCRGRTEFIPRGAALEGSHRFFLDRKKAREATKAP